jgi:hypothetical protein
MKTTLMTIAFATASLFAAQTPAANPPAAATNTPAKPAVVKPVKKHHKGVKQSAAKATPAPAPVSK